ncbi:MAG: CoA transferase, partial [Dehalococcoidia bacterium]
MRLPLEGVRVIDLSMWWAGPFATMELAAMGAEIIKVESIQRLDGYRGVSAAIAGERSWERAPVFNAFNLGKLGITLDLTRPEGTKVFKRLVRVADVVLDNYSARVIENFGLGHDVLRQENPGIITVSMPGFGDSGPWKNYTGFAFNLEQLSGLAHHTGFPDGPPCNIGAAADPIMGMYGAFAVLTALEHRRRTGQGQHVDLAHLEALTAFSGGPVMDFQLNGRVTGRAGNRDPAAAPHNFYPCRGQDQWVAIAVYGDDDWRRLAGAMGEPEWSREPRFADELGRWRHQEELDALIGGWTRDKDKNEVMRLLQEAGVAAGAALDAPGLLADPHLNQRRFYQRLRREEVGVQPYPRTPFLVDGKRL